MSPNSPHYLPLPLSYYTILAGILLVVIAIVELRALRYAYLRIGLSSRAALILLLASLGGSYFNIPVAQLPSSQVLANAQISFFGMRYVIPVAVEWPGTLIAINVGGALIPILMSLYLLIRYRLWWRAAVAVAAVTIVCHGFAAPVRGLGIAMPVFVPPLVAATVALLLSRRLAAPLAYVGGSLGALIGADLLNLAQVQGLGAPIASIGGAGTFDGVFLTGIVAVLLASFVDPPLPPRRAPPGGELPADRPPPHIEASATAE
ncbi:MAG TPA: DUF1614 domain-containing protein [Stellaceae bacterium]|nr:DUF1614 domain-containing protein [Stellaceae bacterium]